jgi:hypothetical protein
MEALAKVLWQGGFAQKAPAFTPERSVAETYFQISMAPSVCGAFFRNFFNSPDRSTLRIVFRDILSLTE